MTLTPPTRRTLLTVAGAAAVAMVAAACSSPADAESAADVAGDLVPLTVGAPWNGTAGKEPAETGPFGYAVDLGHADSILADHGFSYAGFVGFNNGPPAIQALQTNDIQVALLGDTPATQARASGIELPAAYISRPTADIWFLGREGGVGSIAELAGLTVGLQFGSNFDKYGRAVLEREGVIDEVELVNLLFADALPALQRGEVDAVPLPASTAGIWLLQNDFTILSKASEDDPDLLATSVGLVSEQIAASNPEIGDAVWQVWRAGADEIEADHEAYAAWVEEKTGAPADIVLESNLWRYATEPADPEGLATVESTLQFLIDSGTATDSFDPAAWVLP
jgi:sulfonate transport system substrate-binding protein